MPSPTRPVAPYESSGSCCECPLTTRIVGVCVWAALLKLVFNPQQQLLAGGCHLTRRTGELIALAGDAQVCIGTLSRDSSNGRGPSQPSMTWDPVVGGAESIIRLARSLVRRSEDGNLHGAKRLPHRAARRRHGEETRLKHGLTLAKGVSTRLGPAGPAGPSAPMGAIVHTPHWRSACAQSSPPSPCRSTAPECETAASWPRPRLGRLEQ